MSFNPKQPFNVLAAETSGTVKTAQEKQEEIALLLGGHQPKDIQSMKEIIVVAFERSASKGDANGLHLQKILAASPYATWRMMMEEFDKEVYHTWRKWEVSELSFLEFRGQFQKDFNTWLIDKWGGATRVKEGVKEAAETVGGAVGGIVKGATEGLLGGGGVFIVLAVVVIGALIYFSTTKSVTKAVVK